MAGEHTCYFPTSTHIQGWFLTACSDRRQQPNQPLLSHRPESRRQETSAGQASTLGNDHLCTNHTLISFSYIMLVFKLSHYPEASDASSWLSFLLESCTQWSKQMKPKPMTSPMNSCGEWFHRPQSVLDQNCFIAQGNTLYTNTTATRANQLWIHGFVDASSRLLFSRIFCNWMCEKFISREQEREEQDALILQGHETALFCLELYRFPHKRFLVYIQSKSILF